ncbi:MAG: Txe/YoeB family addiction module toxin [Ruminococcus sp.]|jgi:toxin YoeB|nr:Txe/YoeB family addiction module toxin [Ruminococcus sp.]
MNKTWTDKAWEQLLYWQTQDRKTLKKINNLIKSIDRDPFSGEGKPEPLKHELQGCWSRRIDDKNRLIYKITDSGILILECGSHYGEK